MGKIFLFITLFSLTSCATLKRESYEVRELPEVEFRFEDVQRYISSPEDIKEIKTEKSKLLRAETSVAFMRMDLKRSYILDVGVISTNLEGRIAVKRTKKWPAGKYLVVNYKVPHNYHGKLFADIPATIREAKVTPVDLIFYVFNTASPGYENYQLFLRVK